MKNYRVWDSVTEIMYYPEDFKLVIDHGEPELHLQRKLGVVVAKENDIGKSAYLMQYTGLKDKNGVEIYEGDIINFIGTYKDSKGKELGRYKVVWDDYYTGFYPLIDDHLRGNIEWEVIGNIYENPELLEEEE